MNKLCKKFICLSVAILIAFSAIPVIAVSAETVTNETELRNVINAITDDTPATIILANDIALSYAITIAHGRNITIKSADGTVTLTSAAGRHFTVSNTGVVCSLTFDGVVLDGDKTGGGISCTNGAALELYSAVIQNCYTSSTGGGITTATNCNVIIGGGSIIADNRANGNGGGIYCNTGSRISVNGGEIRNNTANINGGGIYGNSSDAAPSMIAVTGVTIEGNTANGSNSTTNGGGGIYGYTGCEITVTDCAITGNTATNANGGAIYTRIKADISGDTTISKNTAASYGGGVFGYTGSAVTVGHGAVIGGDNADDGNAANSGGGIAVYGGSGATAIITIDGGTISNNKATIIGGGICCTGNTASAINIDVSLKNGAKINNNTAGTSGGAIYCSLNNTLAISGGSAISGNTAGSTGGGIFGSKGSKITASGSSISGNKAITGGGVALYSAAIDATDCVISKNNVSGFGGGISSYQDLRGASSAVGITYKSEIALTGCDVTGNGAANGGAIAAYNAFDSAGSNNTAECVITADGCDIGGNSATENGGGIYSHTTSVSGSKVAKTNITITGGSITGNTAVLNGGGFYGYNYGSKSAANCIITVNGGDINGNNASNGGGFYGYSSSSASYDRGDCLITVNDSSVSANAAIGNGGGICGDVSSKVNVSGGGIKDNNAVDGGGIWIFDLANLTTNNAYFSQNKASVGYKWTLDVNSANAAIKKASETHLANIIDTVYTKPFTNAYNNYDVNFSNVPGITTSSYTLSYNANGGTGGLTLTDFSYGDVHTVLSADAAGIAKDGYKLYHWNISPDGTGMAYSPGGSIVIDDDLTLYAHWTINEPVPDVFTVTFDSKGGGPVPPQIVASGQKAARPDDPTKTGYLFDGWYMDESYTETWDFANTVTADITLYARWTINETIPSNYYTVTYNANGGTGGRNFTGFAYYQKHTVLSAGDAEISNDVSEFYGWNTSPDGTGTAYSPGDFAVIDGNLTLYAQWSIEIGEPEPPPTGLGEGHVVYLIGYPDKSIGADNPITRAEVTAIFFRLLTNPGKAQILPQKFIDVPEGLWYTQYVNYLADAGVIDGRPGGPFRPDRPITRAEFSTVVSRLYKLPFARAVDFTDINSNHWAYKSICAAYESGWINRYPDGSFRPDEPISRMEAVIIVNARLDRKIDEVALSKITNPYNDITNSHPGYAEIIEASIEHVYSRDEHGTEMWVAWQ